MQRAVRKAAHIGHGCRRFIVRFRLACTLPSGELHAVRLDVSMDSRAGHAVAGRHAAIHITRDLRAVACANAAAHRSAGNSVACGRIAADVSASHVVARRSASLDIAAVQAVARVRTAPDIPAGHRIA